MRPGCTGGRVGCLAAMLLATGAAHAQRVTAPQPPGPQTGPSTPSPITDHLAFTGMYFWGTIGTHARFDSPPLRGTPFSAEQQLGLSRQAHQPLVELMFRMRQRNRLRLDFLDLRRTGNAALSAPLQFGSTLFASGKSVHSELDWRQTDLTYTYSFLRNDRFELAFGPALHLLQAYASANVPRSPQSQVYSEAGPFATLALDGAWRISQRWSFNARAQYFRLAVDHSSGELGDYHADVQYRIGGHLGLGAGYEYRRAQVDLPRTRPPAFVQLNVSGPELFVRASL